MFSVREICKLAITRDYLDHVNTEDAKFDHLLLMGQSSSIGCVLSSTGQLKKKKLKNRANRETNQTD